MTSVFMPPVSPFFIFIISSAACFALLLNSLYTFKRVGSNGFGYECFAKTDECLDDWFDWTDI